MVKPNWDTEELIENWTLLPTELELLENKVGGNKIGFALLLKHFQLLTWLDKLGKPKHPPRAFCSVSR